MSVETLPLPSSPPAAPSEGASARERAADQGHGHRHTPHPAAGAAPRSVKVAPSVLRLSLAGRLALAVALLVPLWAAVVLVLG